MTRKNKEYTRWGFRFYEKAKKMKLENYLNSIYRRNLTQLRALYDRELQRVEKYGDEVKRQFLYQFKNAKAYFVHQVMGIKKNMPRRHMTSVLKRFADIVSLSSRGQLMLLNLDQALRHTFPQQFKQLKSILKAEGDIYDFTRFRWTNGEYYYTTKTGMIIRLYFTDSASSNQSYGLEVETL